MGGCCGPVSMAGERGPERREFERAAAENAHWKFAGSEGELMAATGGRTGREGGEDEEDLSIFPFG